MAIHVSGMTSLSSTFMILYLLGKQHWQKEFLYFNINVRSNLYKQVLWSFSSSLYLYTITIYIYKTIQKQEVNIHLWKKNPKIRKKNPKHIYFTPWSTTCAQSSAIFPYIKILMLLIREHELSISTEKKKNQKWFPSLYLLQNKTKQQWEVIYKRKKINLQSSTFHLN